MSAQANKALVQRLFDEVWNPGDVSNVGAFYAADYTSDYLPYSEKRGLDGIREMVLGARVAFPDYHEDLIEMIAEDDRVAVRLRISGTHLGYWGPIPPTGKRVSYEEMLILRFRDGKVVHQRGVPDNLSMLRQLGVVPIPQGQTAARPE